MTEEDVLKSEERFRQMAETIAAVFWLADAVEPKILYVSPAYDRLWGRDHKRLYTHFNEFFESIHPDDQERVRSASSRCVLQEQFEIEYRIVRPDGEVRWVRDHGFLIRDQTGTPYRIAGFAEDVTDRNRTEAALRESEALQDFLLRLADVLRLLSDPVAIQGEACRLLADRLNVDRAYYVEVDEKAGIARVERDFVRDGSFSLVGEHSVANFSWSVEILRRGECLIIADTQTSPLVPPPDRPASAALQIIACMGVPLIKAGQFVGALCVTAAQIREWSESEVELLREVGDRIWAAVERAHAEAALRESEEKYRSLFASLDAGCCIIEVLYDENEQAFDYRFVEMNQAFERQSGFTDAAGKTIRELVPDIEPQWAETYGRVAQTGESMRFEADVTSMNRVFDIYAFRIGLPTERKVGVLFNDISDRKRAEQEREQLLAREQRYTTKLRELNQAAIALNAALTLEEVLNVVTQQAYQIIGTHQAVINLVLDGDWSHTRTIAHLSDKYAQWREYDAQPDGTGIYAMICQINQSIRMTQAQLEAHPRWRGFGEEAENHPPLRGWLAAPLAGRDGQMIGLIQLSDKYEGEFTEEDEAILVQLAQMAAIAVENARLYEAEQQARAVAETAREAAESANRIKDEFLAVLSHELRSPLNPILGWTRLLQNGKLNEVRRTEALKTIERNARLQTQLIEDLLDISRIMQGKLSLTVAPTSLTYVISAAIETVRLAAEAKNIEISLDLDPAISPISGDAARLQQVVWNLLTNAVKFTPNDGQVTVELRQLDHLAQIRVIDTGKGISPNFLPHVFEYFRQEDGSTTRKFGGLGLGLAIVRQIVEMHGGMVWAESQGENQGATFIVQLPVLSRATSITSESVRTQVDEEAPLNGIQILLVDDETDTREFQVFLLEQNGANVTAVTSGLEALQSLDQFTPDVIVSDVGMAEMDGYKLIQQIRSRSAEQGGMIRAIALTAYAADVDQQKALQAGFQTHLTKPVEPEVLVRTVVVLTSRDSDS